MSVKHLGFSSLVIFWLGLIVALVFCLREAPNCWIQFGTLQPRTTQLVKDFWYPFFLSESKLVNLTLPYNVPDDANLNVYAHLYSIASYTTSWVNGQIIRTYNLTSGYYGIQGKLPIIIDPPVEAVTVNLTRQFRWSENHWQDCYNVTMRNSGWNAYLQFYNSRLAFGDVDVTVNGLTLIRPVTELYSPQLCELFAFSPLIAMLLIISTGVILIIIKHC